jgi:hypothetical protein
LDIKGLLEAFVKTDLPPEKRFKKMLVQLGELLARALLLELGFMEISYEVRTTGLFEERERK